MLSETCCTSCGYITLHYSLASIIFEIFHHYQEFLFVYLESSYGSLESFDANVYARRVLCYLYHSFCPTLFKRYPWVVRHRKYADMVLRRKIFQLPLQKIVHLAMLYQQNYHENINAKQKV